jgi:helicase-like protein
VCFVPRWTEPPAIVAEVLIGVPDPLLTALHPGTPASGAAVASYLAATLLPPEHHDQAPAWLLPEQQRSFRRVLAAVRRYGGAVLADPVGSGKTFVALAVAATLNRGSTACLVPATLLDQWKLAALRAGVRVTLCSHEQVSRGRLPAGSRGLVIIDESHRFRNQTTKRYIRLAPWLVGRPALLLTATPVVNCTADLAHQLLLAVRDDALAKDGVASLRALLESGRPPSSLGQLVIEGEAANHRLPERVLRVSPPSDGECAAMENLVKLLGELRLSQCKPIAALIHSVLLRAAGSSPAALYQGLCQYRKLLLHAGDALRAGRSLDRAELRHFTGELNDQLIWWELLPSSEAKTEVELEDLPDLERLILSLGLRLRQTDGKLERLRTILTETTPTLVFSTSRATVRYIRDQMPALRLAWCTGDRAGIGMARMPRTVVLGWFREPVNSSLAPWHLIVTDLAAEGLDLQRAARVVHYDLPWTPMRLEQREGRSARYGSPYHQVEVIRFAPPPALERSLGLEEALIRKANLPRLLGLGTRDPSAWRCLASLPGQFGQSLEAQAGVAAVHSNRHGLLAGFALHEVAESEPLSATVLWMDPDGTWTEAPEVIAERLESALQERRVLSSDSGQLRDWLSLLAPPIRQRLLLSQSRRWMMPDPTPAARRLLAHLQSLIREAARNHQARRLAELERALAFVAGGHTAGEEALIERLAEMSDRELWARVRTLPEARAGANGIEVRLTGLIVFGRGSFGQ